MSHTPRVSERELEKDVAAERARLDVDVVAQVETPLGFHDELKQANDVAVFLEKLQLELVFVTFDFFAHAPIMPGRAPGGAVPPRARPTLWPGSASSTSGGADPTRRALR